MIAYELQNKNVVVFFSICYSIRSEFITEAATEISSSKQLLCNCGQKARKTFLKKFIFQLRCLLEDSNFAKMNPLQIFLKYFKHRCRTTCILFPVAHFQNRNCLVEYFLVAAPYTLKWYQTFGNGMRNLYFKLLFKCHRILSTSKCASIDDFPSKISSAKAIAKVPQ